MRDKGVKKLFLLKFYINFKLNIDDSSLHLLFTIK